MEMLDWCLTKGFTPYQLVFILLYRTGPESGWLPLEFLEPSQLSSILLCYTSRSTGIDRNPKDLS